MSLPDPDEPIAAAASAAGGGARAVLRTSGPGAPGLVRTLFTPHDPAAWPRRAAGRVTGELRLDAFPVPVPGAALVWPTGRSYTGQPSVELHLPGSPPVVEAALAALYAAGFRPAGPGEFTLRAFLAGRVGLTEAEAVLGVIDAADPRELETALDQLAGGVSNKLAPVRSDLLDLLADLEAGLDFSEDEDVSFLAPRELSDRIAAARAAAAGLAADAAGRTVSGTRPTVVLAGPPNAGKSTLFNALLDTEAALVSAAAGTTRDDLSAPAVLAGVPVELIDTAGEESGDDELSAAAQRRRAERIAAADLVLHCVPPGGGAKRPETSAAALTVFTKADLSPGGGGFQAAAPPTRRVSEDRGAAAAERSDGAADFVPRPSLTRRVGGGSGGVSVSAATGAGLEELRTAIAAALATAAPRRQWTGQTAARGGAALREAVAALDRATDTVGRGDELTAAELRAAVDALGEVLGVVYQDDLLGRIFGRFCIGK